MEDKNDKLFGHSINQDRFSAHLKCILVFVRSEAWGTMKVLCSLGDVVQQTQQKGKEA